MSAFVTKGSVQYGSFAQLIGAVTYTFNNCTVNRPGTIVERMDSANEPDGFVGVHQAVTLSAELEYPSASVSPALGAEFTKTFTGQSQSESFVITGKTDGVTAAGTTKINIEARMFARNGSAAYY